MFAISNRMLATAYVRFTGATKICTLYVTYLAQTTHSLLSESNLVVPMLSESNHLVDHCSRVKENTKMPLDEGRFWLPLLK